jgi:hypothetical protein
MSMPEFEAVFNLFALGDGDAAVVSADDCFLREVVDGAGDAFGEAAIVDEDECWAMGFDLFEELRMNGAPDGWADGALRCGAAGERVDLVEAGHVFDGDFDAEVEALGFAGVDDGDGAVDGGVKGRFEFGERLVGSWRGRIGLGVEIRCWWFRLCRCNRQQIHRARTARWRRVPRFARNDIWWKAARWFKRGFAASEFWSHGYCWDFGAAKEAGDFFEGALRGGKADALQAATGQAFKAFEWEREVRAALGGDERVNFVEDDGVDGTEEFARLRR